MTDPGNTPLIVGSAQLTDRRSGAGNEPAPDEMLADVARGAAADSGSADRLLAAVDSIVAVEAASWPVADPGRLLARRLGIEPAETVRALAGGIAPILALADACTRISAGESRAVLIAGVECFDVLLRAMKEGRDPGFRQQPEDAEPSRTIGSEGETSHPVESAAGLIAPVAYYPLFESALRATAGRDRDSHQRYLGQLWARFSAVSPTNPHAWSTETHDAEEIATPGPGNRQVSIPYTKLMNSNIQTNQAAAMVVCSAALADELGIEPRRRARVRATATASDHPFAGERERLDRSPALAACGRLALAHTGLTAGEIEHLDIYSCFPSAVQVAERELGIDPLDPDRAPTVTGGLSFAGGPGSNYVSHSIAALHERLRENGGHALATGVGWYLTKHGVVILSAAGDAAEAPPYEHFNPQQEAEAAPRRELRPPPGSGSAEIEAYTALCDRSGDPELGIASLLLDDGARTIAKADDPATLTALGAEEALGRRAALTGSGRFTLTP